jgi:hypothetical protein
VVSDGSVVAGREEDAFQRRDGGVGLRLKLEPGEPLAGTIAIDGQSEKRFCGWIELMAAVNAARRRAVGEA